MNESGWIYDFWNRERAHEEQRERDCEIAESERRAYERAKRVCQEYERKHGKGKAS